MGFVRLFVSTRGRLSRTEFWVMFGVLGVIEQLLCGLVMTLFQCVYTGLSEDQLALVAGLVHNVVAVPCAWPYMVLIIKRYHDLNKSGSSVLLFIAPIGLGAIGVSAYLDGSHLSGIVVYALAITAFIWPTIELSAFQGSPGDNDFGPRLRWKEFFPDKARHLGEPETALPLPIGPPARRDAANGGRTPGRTAPAPGLRSTASGFGQRPKPAR